MSATNLIRFDIYMEQFDRHYCVDLPAVPTPGDEIYVLTKLTETEGYTPLLTPTPAQLVVERTIWRSEDTQQYGTERRKQPHPVLVCTFKK